MYPVSLPVQYSNQVTEAITIPTNRVITTTSYEPKNDGDKLTNINVYKVFENSGMSMESL